MLETQVKNALQLADRLNVKLDLGDEVTKSQNQMGLGKDTEIGAPIRANVKPVPINKVGEYCEGEDGNNHLPVEYAGVKTMAILDSGVGIAIATKQIWTKWGKPALRKTRMRL